MISGLLKPALRLIYYQNERKKILREIKIRKNQNKLIKELDKTSSQLIVFVVDGTNWFTGKDNISGGILSIASIYEETCKLKHIHGCEVIMVTHPKAHLLLKHTQFPNEITVFRFQQLLRFDRLKKVIVHIPEYQFNAALIAHITNKFPHLPPQAIHLNILNQRIDIMPEVSIISKVLEQGFTVTQTTAHEQYSTKEIRDKYGIPLHKLSVYATPERYQCTPFECKESVILVSPDRDDLKAEILVKIKTELPGFKVQVINGITYMDYLKLIAKAKYMITLGEGLDFYFIETVFSGGISFAVYNQEFFTSDFEHLPAVFNNSNGMLENITQQIRNLEKDLALYQSVNKQQFDACHKIYNGKDYQENLINFYKKNYLFP